jgi:hypothetical protein
LQGKHPSYFDVFLYVIVSSGLYGVLTASFGRLRIGWASAADRFGAGWKEKERRRLNRSGHNHLDGIHGAVHGTEFTANAGRFIRQYRQASFIVALFCVAQGKTSHRTGIQTDNAGYAAGFIDSGFGPVFAKSDALNDATGRIHHRRLRADMTACTAFNAKGGINMLHL